jgi:hypothetical protein
MSHNYTAKAPSIATTITNSEDPGADWKFMGVSSAEDVQRQPRATMDGTMTVVLVPFIIYTATYFTMKPITSGVVQQEVVDGSADLTVGGTTFDNVYLIGGNITFQDSGRGVIGCNYAQDLLVLGQRVAYGA